jgi:transposase
MGQTQSKVEVVREYRRGGVSLRFLSAKYGISLATLHGWVKAQAEEAEVDKPARANAVSAEVRKLQRELEVARLEVKIYKTMIDIAERDLGIQIRKKRGAK